MQARLFLQGALFVRDAGRFERQTPETSNASDPRCLLRQIHEVCRLEDV
jgi:hypothetical protein